MVADLPEILSGPDFRSPHADNSQAHSHHAHSPETKGPLLVFNNSRVRKARLKAYRQESGTDSKAEFLLLRRIDSHIWQTMVNRTKRRRIGARFRFDGGLEGELVEPPAEKFFAEEKEKNLFGNSAERTGEFRYIRFDSPIDDDWLDIHGHIPLPPYIKRDDEEEDDRRYQTIYADRAAGADIGPGASTAAPTAGLHFTKDLLARLDAAGTESVYITLHVGLGTFLPVRTENIEDHVMHEEVYSISEDAAKRINAAKAAGRKIIAVGTTSVRTLESAFYEGAENPHETASGEKSGYVKAGEGTTSIFIYPGYRFKMVDALFTNFHTPGSTLLMLVAAFASANAFAEANAFTGRQLILESYSEAVRERYRFFSYGDAMLIH